MPGPALRGKGREVEVRASKRNFIGRGLTVFLLGPFSNRDMWGKTDYGEQNG